MGTDTQDDINKNNSSWVVLKFGGTSVASKACMDNMLEIIRQRVAAGLNPLVVCSAPRGVSDLLEQLPRAAILGETKDILNQVHIIYQQLADDLALDCALLTDFFARLSQLAQGIALLKEVSCRIQAEIMAMGELMLTHLAVAYFVKKGLDVTWQDAREWLVCELDRSVSESSHYLSARCDVAYSSSIGSKLSDGGHSIIVTQGFIASDHVGDTVLLGRGGSDTSAAYMSVLLGACRCEIWTDVPGIYTADPHHIPQARLITQLDYDEAQEISSMGAKVLHPKCIGPLKQHGLPLHIKYTAQPQRSGTVVSMESDRSAVQIKSILARSGVYLVNIETVRMWQQVGFLAKVFQCFEAHGVSIDLISTSEASVCVSIDAQVNGRNKQVVADLLNDLNEFARASIIGPCASISLVGHNIRAILHKLGGVFELFEQQQIYLLSQAANDLNLTFVVDEDQAQRMTQKLHTLLIEQTVASHYFDRSWLQEFGDAGVEQSTWWQSKEQKLLDVARQCSPVYVYDADTLCAAANRLNSCDALDQVFYAVKANPNAEILKVFYELGLGFECVSISEVNHVLSLFVDIDRHRVLFTPNFASHEEYAQALEYGVHVTIDNVYPLEQWPELFAKQPIFVRVDPGHGHGHHKYVVTGGTESKFGIPMDCMEQLSSLAQHNQTKIVGLHAHSGSGILNAENWHDVASSLMSVLQFFPDVVTIDLGGGLGISEKPGQADLDLVAFNQSLLQVKQALPDVSIWIEPGRYLVAHAGVLLARVTQLKQKGDMHFVGIETGMNSLIRPALYGSYHEIVNLTRLSEPKTHIANIVGPICESGDTLGYSRLLPKTQEGDVLLIANVGAYGRCMSSRYNLREPAEEYVLSLSEVTQSTKVLN